MPHIDFTDAFTALTGHAPFPWQRRLFERMCAGEVPRALDLPTGLGKTSAMAIWLVAKAAGALLPRRLVYIIDRRAVVDQATAEAERLRARLEEGDAAVLKEMRSALGLGDRPFPVSTLRGRFADNREWLSAPDGVAIVVGTVAMIGSRLLFSGYGVGRRMRPVQAALLGVDALFVLDESHLVPPFEALLDRLTTGRAELGEPSDGSAPPPRLLALSATGGEREDVFSLDAEDEAHSVVGQRIQAVKKVEIREAADAKALPEHLAEAALELVTQEGGLCPGRVIVFCDRRQDARKAAAALVKDLKAHGLTKQEAEVRVRLFTGARRGFERERDTLLLAELGFLAGEAPLADGGEPPAFLVATSAAEVGVDLDSDHMVADLVEWERTVQRLGRVNRRGAREASRVVVLDASAAQKDADRRERLKRTRALLERLASMEGGASPANLSRLRREADENLITAASTPPPLWPRLERAQIEDWAMTALDDHPGRAPVGPWLRGWVSEEPTAEVIWRRHLPWGEKMRAPRAEEVEEFFRLARPHPVEGIETTISEIVKGVRKRAKAVKQASEEARRRGEKVDETRYRALLLSPSRRLRRGLVLDDLAALGEKGGSSIGPRDLLVLPACFGGLDREGFLSGAAKEDVGVADDGSLDEGFSVLRQAWAAAPEEVLGYKIEAGGEAPDAEEEEAGTKVSGRGRWRRAFAMVLSESEEGKLHMLSVLMPRNAVPPDRAVGRDVFLVDHLEHVREEVAALAARLGLPEKLRKALEAAGLLHDLGKKRALWQDFAMAPRDRRPLAKSAAGYRGPGFLGGYRHEFGSLTDIEGKRHDPVTDAAERLLTGLDAEMRALLLHLVAAHHGEGGR